MVEGSGRVGGTQMELDLNCLEERLKTMALPAELALN